MAFTKNLIRAGVVVALAGAATAMFVGPERIGALFSQTRGAVNRAIDGQIKDPVALRQQLRSLEEQYPKRIAEVRGDLAEVNEQVAQLERELAVSRKVVQLADRDLAQMKDLLARAEEARAAEDGYSIVKVRFDGRAMDVDDAYAKANKISQLRSAYATRAADLEKELGYLAEQRGRLDNLLQTLESERAQFQTQLWQLDRQVDTISRNERLIEVMEKRQETIDEQSRYHAVSLDQIHARLADIRAKQEAKLEMLAKGKELTDYENVAKWELDRQSGQADPFTPAPDEIEIEPSVIEITPREATQDGSVASAAPARR